MPLSAVDPARYDMLLAQKAEQVGAQLATYSPPQAEVYPSAPLGYRMRAEFRMWHDGDKLDYVMYRADDPKTAVAIDHFPIACERIQQLMPELKTRLVDNETLRRKLSG